MKPLILALHFLTRLPLRMDWQPEDKDYRRAMVFFPFVGLVIGGLLLSVYSLAGLVFPEILSRVITLAFFVIITGALHLDGLADTADGFCQPRGRDEILRIMEDPHIGAFGVTAICLVLLLKAACFVVLPELTLTAALIVMPIIGRSAMVAAMCYMPYAKPQGLAKPFVSNKSQNALVIAVAVSLTVSFVLLGIAGLVATLAVACGIALFLYYIYKKINGVTGDIIGAVNELAELISLLAICAFNRETLFNIEKLLPLQF